MATSRYTYVPRLNTNLVATTDITSRIYFGCQNSTIDYVEYDLKEGQRLDHIAANVYSDSNLWWIIAAASGAGWSLQCPPGTVLRVPNNLTQIYDLLR